MIVAIDGPAGSGKSTVARALAATKGLTYLDTGAMYRSVTCAALERGINPNDKPAVIALAKKLNLEFINGENGPEVFIDGADCTAQIRTPEVDENVSVVAAIPEVREAMLVLQRKMAQTGDCVAEGRDIGTVVFPEAEVKVFLVADPTARARRRAVQRSGGDLAKDAHAQVDENAAKAIEAELIERDRKDSTREVAPLKAADDAIKIDSTSLSVDEVCAKIAQMIDEARA